MNSAIVAIGIAALIIGLSLVFFCNVRQRRERMAMPAGKLAVEWQKPSEKYQGRKQAGWMASSVGLFALYLAVIF